MHCMRRTGARQPCWPPHPLSLPGEVDVRRPLELGRGPAAALALALRLSDPRVACMQAEHGQHWPFSGAELGFAAAAAARREEQGASCWQRAAHALSLAMPTCVPTAVNARARPQATRRLGSLGGCMQQKRHQHKLHSSWQRAHVAKATGEQGPGGLPRQGMSCR